MSLSYRATAEALIARPPQVLSNVFDKYVFPINLIKNSGAALADFWDRQSNCYCMWHINPLEGCAVLLSLIIISTEFVTVGGPIAIAEWGEPLKPVDHYIEELLGRKSNEDIRKAIHKLFIHAAHTAKTLLCLTGSSEPVPSITSLRRGFDTYPERADRRPVLVLFEEILYRRRINKSRDSCEFQDRLDLLSQSVVIELSLIEGLQKMHSFMEDCKGWKSSTIT